MMMAFGDRGANRPIGGFPAPRRLCRDEVVREGLATARNRHGASSRYDLVSLAVIGELAAGAVLTVWMVHRCEREARGRAAKRRSP